MNTALLEVKATKVDDDVLEFTASTDHVDRVGDIIEQNWDLSGIRKNPVFLWGHDYGDLPVGKITRIWTERVKAKGEKKPRNLGKGLVRTKIRVKFVPADVHPFAGTVKRLFEEGFLSAVSVGFRPLEVRDLSDEEKEDLGMTGFWPRCFKRSELLEVSAVTVPANANALLDGKKLAAGAKGIFANADQARLFVEKGDPGRESFMKGIDARGLRKAVEAADDEWELDESVTCSFCAAPNAAEECDGCGRGIEEPVEEPVTVSTVDEDSVLALLQERAPDLVDQVRSALADSAPEPEQPSSAPQQDGEGPLATRIDRLCDRLEQLTETIEASADPEIPDITAGGSEPTGDEGDATGGPDDDVLEEDLSDDPELEEALADVDAFLQGQET